MRDIDLVAKLTKILMLIEISGNKALVNIVSEEMKPLFEYFGKKWAEEDNGGEDE